MDALAVAQRWARTWERAWPARATDDIIALYADGASYRASALRGPEPGGAAAYLGRQFAVEENVRCRFGDPVAAGDRAAVEWWASWVESGQPVTLAGVTVLRFDDCERVVDHVDYWLSTVGRHEPYSGWGSASDG